MSKEKQSYMDYIVESCQELVQLNDKKEYRTMLVRRNSDGRIFIKKEVPLPQGGIYQQMQSVAHPNLVRVHHVCFGQDSCVVLEDYISGRTLQEELQEKGKLPVEEIWNYFGQLLDALETIHKYNIIHRDIKPENILISSDNVVKLLDFGIARFQKDNQPKDTMVLGTVGYASPEQFGFQQTDVRTDIYAAGILLNKMLTGKMPNEAQVQDEGIRKIIQKCMELDPRNRFDSVASLRHALMIAGKKRKSKVCQKEVCLREMDETWVPGFRSGEKWKRVLASMGYAFLLLASVIYISEAAAGGIAALILETVAILIYIWIPVVVAANLFRWDGRVPVIRRLPKEIRITIRVVLCILAFYFGILLENYVKYGMMGLPGD